MKNRTWAGNPKIPSQPQPSLIYKVCPSSRNGELFKIHRNESWTSFDWLRISTLLNADVNRPGPRVPIASSRIYFLSSQLCVGRLLGRAKQNVHPNHKRKRKHFSTPNGNFDWPQAKGRNLHSLTNSIPTREQEPKLTPDLSSKHPGNSQERRGINPQYNTCNYGSAFRPSGRSLRT